MNRCCTATWNVVAITIGAPYNMQIVRRTNCILSGVALIGTAGVRVP